MREVDLNFYKVLFEDLDPDKLKKRFLRLLLTIQNVERGSIWVKQNNEYVCIESLGSEFDTDVIKGASLSADQPSIVGWVMENAQMTIAEPGKDSRHFEEFEEGMKLKSTSHKFIVTGGLKGSLTSNISYDASFNYSLVDDMYFYVNDSVPLLKNHLTAVQDDYEAFRIYGELSYRYSEKLWFHVNQNIYRYNLDTELHPWHRPLYDLTFSTRYNLRNKILANLDIFYAGQQYARNFNTAEDPYLIAGTLDFNIGVEYRYTEIMSVFLRLNHILGSENFIYYQYPTMRFNLMAGFTYSL